MPSMYWAPHGTPRPTDMDRDGVPVSLTPDGATRWEYIGGTPDPPLPTLNLDDLLDPDEGQP